MTSDASWAVVKLDDVADDITVGHVGPMATEYGPSGVPFLRSQNVEPFRIVLDDVKYVSQAFHARLAKSALQPGDVVIVRTGRPGSAAVIPTTLPVANCSDLVIVRPGPKLDAHFLMYFVNSAGSEHVASHLVGAVQQHFNVGSARTLLIPLPPVTEQRRIARTLGALDDKIELNRRMNRTLESIARAIFKSWFVDFDPVRRKMEGGEAGLPDDLAVLFPAEMDASSVGRIPKGWRRQPLGEVARFTRGRSYKGVELAPSDTALVTLKSFNRSGGYRADGLKDYTGPFKAEQVVNAGDVLVAHTDVTQAAEVLGRAIRVRRSSQHSTLVASLDTAIVRPMGDRMPREYLFFALDNERFRDHAYGYCNGTTVLHLGARALPEYRLVLPSQELAATFSRIVGSMLSRADLLAAESAALASARDCLLPRLLGGGLGS